ncbi:GspH/FimT family pseudopilin [Candidatus Sumerlaeota bacterium]|nr:GspH/FimT family pseudopilin [Candidatus Sumerlaeota bacterium]
MRKLGTTEGFTLIELICVLAILATIITVSAPSLGGFFRGRSLTEESRRFLAVTRYARSDAISRSVPVELWIDSYSGSYGVRRMINYGEGDEKSLEYQLDENLEFELDAEDMDEEGNAALVFQPDGFMDQENPEEIVIRKNDAEKTVFEKSISGMEYMIEDEEENE